MCGGYKNVYFYKWFRLALFCSVASYAGHACSQVSITDKAGPEVIEVAAEVPLSNWVPTSAVRIVVPYGRGGGADLVARHFANALTDSFDKTFVVDNKPGGLLTFEDWFSKQSTDGHTLTIVTSDVFSVLSNFDKSSPQEFGVSFIAQLAAMPYVLASNPAASKTLDELIRQPGQYENQVSSMPYILMEIFKSVTGAKLTNVVPARGGTSNDYILNSINHVLNNTMNASFFLAANVIPLVSTGKLRAFGLTGNSRLSELPAIPTFSEQGIARLEYVHSFILAAPKGAKSDVVKAYSQVVSVIQKKETFKKFFSVGGRYINTISPDAVHEELLNEKRNFSVVLRSIVIKND